MKYWKELGIVLLFVAVVVAVSQVFEGVRIPIK